MVPITKLLLTAPLLATAAHHGWADYEWLAVLAPPSRMNRRGIPSDSVQVGPTARLYGYPHKEIEDEMRAEHITINGHTAELR